MHMHMDMDMCMHMLHMYSSTCACTCTYRSTCSNPAPPPHTHLPQGAKAIIKQAVEEYKQTNALGGGELALLDKLLINLGTAAPPAQPFGGSPSGGTPAGGPPAPTDLTDEVSADAPGPCATPLTILHPDRAIAPNHATHSYPR